MKDDLSISTGSIAFAILFAAATYGTLTFADLSITWHDLSPGGVSYGETLMIRGSMGQPEGLGTQAGDTLTVQGGFWSRQFTGACCTIDDCASETIEQDCNYIGGIWYADTSCEEIDCDLFDCPDVNGDQVIDILDLLAVIGAWGSSGPLGDINDDGTVNVLDLIMMLKSWGPCE